MKPLDKRIWKSFDYLTLLLITALVVMGLLGMTNALADPATGDMTLSAKLESLNLHYPSLQLAWFALGLCVIFVMALMDYQALADYVKYAYLAILGLLVVLVILKYTVGQSNRGVAGWFNLGSRGLQPSEFGKVVLIVVLAKFCGDAMDKGEGKVKGLRALLPPLIATALPVILIAVQPDWGTAFVYLCILAGVLFAARVSWKAITAAGVAVCAGLPLAYHFLMTPDQQKRITTFLNPDAADVLNEAYHSTAGTEVIQSGGLTGMGFMKEGSLTQLGYLPEQHTDYIFASIVEAMGFIGGVIVIALYFFLLIRTLYIGTKARDSFGMLICVGVASMMLAHVFENIGMLLEIMPVTGIPLPFVSYGGSSMLSSMMAYGLVINVWIRRQQKRKF